MEGAAEGSSGAGDFPCIAVCGYQGTLCAVFLTLPHAARYQA